jgi:hypothetical protein
LIELRRSTVTKTVRRGLGPVVLTLVLVLLNSGEARSGISVGARLYAKVTRAGGVSVRDAAGRLVRTIPAGSYAVRVRDMSKHQNLHLVGSTSTIDKRTGIRFAGTVWWTLTFQAGTYRAYSDRRPSGLASFRVD